MDEQTDKEAPYKRCSDKATWAFSSRELKEMHSLPVIYKECTDETQIKCFWSILKNSSKKLYQAMKKTKFGQKNSGCLIHFELLTWK